MDCNNSRETLSTTLSSLPDEEIKESDNIPDTVMYRSEEDNISLASSISTLDCDFESHIHDDILESFRTNVQRKIILFFNSFPKIVNFEHLPEWLKDNQFITSGYREPSDSIKNVFLSLTQYHNETINIWSHLLGSLIFISMCLWFGTRNDLLIPLNTKLIFLPFFIGAITCMSCSALFHLFLFKSQKFGNFFAKLDYSGIALLIIGSFIPWIYFTFMCHKHLVILYITMIVIMGILAIIVSLFDKFAEPKYRSLRAGVFLTMGLSAIVPGIHLLLVESWEIIVEDELLVWNIIMGCMYVVGALQYALRFPERCCMGKFDYLFHSHQFFHVFVVMAAFLHFFGLCRVAMIKMGSGSCQEQEIESGLTVWKKWFGTFG
uniref:ADIPOR-like receptor IZH1 n=1 Tax=Parastrongyloides trichosuri TaxID=131310 RepID=A0A0N5A1T8_PARTI